MQRTLPYRNWLSSTITTTTTDGSSSAISSGDFMIFESQSGESNETNSVGNMRQNKNSVNATRVAKSISENAIIVVATRGCCMCHVVKNLLLGLGVNPTIFEVNKEDENDVMEELSRIIGGSGGGRTTELPAVFVGGNLFGGLERVMSTHISGELVPILKQAGALWL
ncbi:hypothetical protein RND71_015485 [Anisodus tanguticus]|uniref:Glutaredoxin domain-containing protein n=1 Tax=Anisodus tanguticus TaxID=243964 RepID=A0AAE1S774_9SOLA|nr:hypothetical protein RND71_015485 [Anisodus tanguticus]